MPHRDGVRFTRRYGPRHVHRRRRSAHSLRMGRDADGPVHVALGPKFPTATRQCRRASMRSSLDARDLPHGEPMALELTRTTMRAMSCRSPATVEGAGPHARPDSRLGQRQRHRRRLLIAALQGGEQPWSPLYARAARTQVNEGGDTRSPVDERGRRRSPARLDFTRELARDSTTTARIEALCSCTTSRCIVTSSVSDDVARPCDGSISRRRARLAGPRRAVMRSRA